MKSKERKCDVVCPKLSHSSGVGCSQQVALVETENVLREVSTLYHNGSPSSQHHKMFGVIHSESQKGQQLSAFSPL